MNSSINIRSSLTLRRAFIGITLGFVFLAILIVVLGGTAFQLSRVGTARSAELNERLLPALGQSVELEAATLKYNLANLEFVTGRDEATQARKLAAASAQRKEIDLHAAAVGRVMETPEARLRLDKFSAALKDYDAAVNRLQAALKASDFDQAMKILDGDVARHNATMETALAEICTFVQELSRSNATETQAVLTRNLDTTLRLSAIIAGLALLAVGVVQWISFRIRRPLETAVARMSDFVGQTTETAAQIAGSGQALASGASQQAASLEETSASLEEMAGMTKRNAENAQKANDLAREANQTAAAGASMGVGACGGCGAGTGEGTVGGSGRSAWASVPTHSGVSLSPHTSAEPKFSMIFGQVLVAMQRSRMPAAGSARTGSGCGSHHCGPSLPAW